LNLTPWVFRGRHTVGRYVFAPPSAKILLRLLHNPMLPSSSYVKLAKISPNTLSKLRPVLIDKGFIREHIMDSGNRGRSRRVWEPLDAAKEILSSQPSDGSK